MNDLKDLFSRVLDTDNARPVATRDDMLAAAHRAAARRRARHISAACACVALVVAAVAAVPHWLGQDNDGLSTGTDPGLTSAPSHPTPTPSRSTPVITPDQHAQKMLATLLGHVPSPFATPAAAQVEGSTRIAKEAHVLTEPMKQMFANTFVYRGEKSGAMSAVVTIRDGAVPTGDLCVTAPPEPDAEQGCKVVTAATGDRVRLSWYELPDVGRAEFATRFYQGGSVMIQQKPGGMLPETVAIGRILDEQALADVAADPAFWPTNLGPFPGGS